MEWQLLSFSDLSSAQLYELLKRRNEVFIVEQNCAYQDVDDKDFESLHLFALQDSQILAYCRIIPPGISYSGTSIGRVLVTQPQRGSGLGIKLMKKAIEEMQQRWPNHLLCISAQAYLTEFYQGLGFYTVNEAYLEDGIPHIEMHRQASLPLA